MKAKLLLDEKFLRAVVSLIRTATKEVFVMAYLMACPSEKKPGKEAALYNELVAAVKRGLSVKIVLNHTFPENQVIKQNLEAARWFKSHGIRCRALAGNRTVHAKMIIIDGVSLVIGSHNWSKRAVERNLEASVKVEDSRVVKDARDFYLRIWETAAVMETGKNTKEMQDVTF